MAEIKTITSGNFEAEVLNCKTPVLLDFWADWCMPCKMQSPILDAFVEQIEGQIKIGKVNVDEEAALAQKYQIMSIPTLILIEQGDAIKRVSGVQQAEDLKKLLQG